MHLKKFTPPLYIKRAELCRMTQYTQQLRFKCTDPKMDDDDVVLRHTLPIFTGLGRCPIVNWDFAGAVSIFGPDALPVVHQ